MINPAVNRLMKAIFSIDVDLWFSDMPKQIKRSILHSVPRPLTSPKSHDIVSNSIAYSKNQSMSIHAFYKSAVCKGCQSQETTSQLCADCLNNQLPTVFLLEQQQAHREKELHKLALICRACTANSAGPLLPAVGDIEDQVPCVSFTCHVFYLKK
jgi:hypothetical protein